MGVPSKKCCILYVKLLFPFHYPWQESPASSSLNFCFKFLSPKGTPTFTIRSFLILEGRSCQRMILCFNPSFLWSRWWWFLEGLYFWLVYLFSGLSWCSVVKNPPDNAEDMGSIPRSGRSPEKEMAAHPSTLAWRIAWTEEPSFSLKDKRAILICQRALKNLFFSFPLLSCP